MPRVSATRIGTASKAHARTKAPVSAPPPSTFRPKRYLQGLMRGMKRSEVERRFGWGTTWYANCRLCAGTSKSGAPCTNLARYFRKGDPVATRVGYCGVHLRQGRIKMPEDPHKDEKIRLRARAHAASVRTQAAAVRRSDAPTDTAVVRVCRLRGMFAKPTLQPGFLVLMPNSKHGAKVHRRWGSGMLVDAKVDPRALSPKTVGPIVAADGTVSNNVENGWQFAKVYERHLNATRDGGTAAWYAQREAAAADTHAHRHQPAAKAKETCYGASFPREASKEEEEEGEHIGVGGFVWDWFSYMMSRPFYCAALTAAYHTPTSPASTSITALRKMLHDECISLAIWGYDAWDEGDWAVPTTEEALRATSRRLCKLFWTTSFTDARKTRRTAPFGHEYVLLTTLLLGDRQDLYPWNVRDTQLLPAHAKPDRLLRPRTYLRLPDDAVC